MIYFFILGAILFIAYIIYLINVWQWKKNCQPFYSNESALMMGHRGSPTLITENTLPSFQKAIDQGVDGIELDIRLSKDGQLVVFHDADLKRLSGRTEKINQLSLAELQSVQLNAVGRPQDEIYIPSLNDIVQLLDYIQVINIEVKSDSIFDGQGILTPLIEFLNEHKIDDKCIVSSFNPLFLMRLRLQRPQTVIGFLYNRKRIFHGWDNMIWILRVQPENLHIHYSMLDHWIVRWARKKGMRINSYTINEQEIFNKAKQQKIDGVFTDNIKCLK